MKTKNKLLTSLILATSAATTTAIINKCIKLSAISRNLLSDSESLCYTWRFGNIYYTKSGVGKPLVLVHDLHTASSTFEWNLLINRLKDSYTVYALDLLGCGRSEKPDLTYTNFIYVQLLSDFIKSEIGHRTDIIATGGSGSSVLMACNNSPELFDRIMVINPESIMSCNQIPGKRSHILKFILDLPIVGTLFYNIATSKKSLTEEFTKELFYNPYSLKQNILETYYEAAHLGNSPKSFYASLKCNYTQCNIINALKKINNSIYLVGGSYEDNILEIMKEYKEYNSSIEYSIISNAKHLPQVENAPDMLNLVYMFFC